jgi:hypothetical protein
VQQLELEKHREAEEKHMEILKKDQQRTEVMHKN